MSNSLPPHGLQPTRPLCPWDFPGKNTCMENLKGIFPTQRSNQQSLVSCIAGRFFTAKLPGKLREITYFTVKGNQISTPFYSKIDNDERIEKCKLSKLLPAFPCY